MNKLVLRLVVVLFLILIVSISILVIEIKTDYGCFHILSPTSPHIAELINLRLPKNISNLRWRCESGVIEGDEIYLKFTMTSNDLKLFTTDNMNYVAWDFIQPKFFFKFINDYTKNEDDLINYRTFQDNSASGWTNLLIDMDNPDIYTVYADYRDLEQLSH